MTNIYTITEAKNKLPAIIHQVEVGATAQLTRHGRPVAVLVSINEYNQLKKKVVSFWEAFCRFRETAAGVRDYPADPAPGNLRDQDEGRKVVFE